MCMHSCSHHPDRIPCTLIWAAADDADNPWAPRDRSDPRQPPRAQQGGFCHLPFCQLCLQRVSRDCRDRPRSHPHATDAARANRPHRVENGQVGSCRGFGHVCGHCEPVGDRPRLGGDHRGAQAARVRAGGDAHYVPPNLCAPSPVGPYTNPAHPFSSPQSKSLVLLGFNLFRTAGHKLS